ATNKDLIKEIEKGQFRMDLYHRLGVILIHVPSLNDRLDDIPLLAERFVKEICEDSGIPKKVITPNAIKELQNINWTGNISELHNIIERLIILSDAKIIEEDVKKHVPSQRVTHNPTELFEQFSKFQDFKDHIERMFIE